MTRTVRPEHWPAHDAYEHVEVNLITKCIVWDGERLWTLPHRRAGAWSEREAGPTVEEIVDPTHFRPLKTDHARLTDWSPPEPPRVSRYVRKGTPPGPRPKELHEKRVHPVQTGLTAEEHACFQAHAHAQRCSISELVRRGISMYITPASTSAAVVDDASLQVDPPELDRR